MQPNLKINLDLKHTLLKRRSLAGGNWLAALMFTVLTVAFLAKAAQFNLVGNLQILAIIIAPIGIVAVGQTLVVLIGGLDLSVGSMVALIGVITAILTSRGVGPLDALPPALAVLVGLSVATGLGWVHGKLISRFHLAPFIVTFGSLSLLRGLAQVISNGAPINPENSGFSLLWINVFNLIPLPAIIMILVFVMGVFVLRNTRFGRHIYAVGSNENVARLSGINIAQTQQIVYAISGFLAGLAGILLMAWIQAGTFNNGQDYELLTIAAVIIGGTSLKGGSGGLWGTLAGVFLMSLVNSSLFLFNVPSMWNGAVVGAIIVGAALIDTQRRKKSDSWIALRPTVSPALPPAQPTSLDQALKRLVQNIGERFHDVETRVYLLARTDGHWIDPVKETEPSGPLPTTVQETGRSLAIPDLNREKTLQVAPFRPNYRAVAAVPIVFEDRLIGVVEAQSPTAKLFGKTELRFLEMVCMQNAQTIEDRWLLESGWLTQQVREALRNLNDDVYLSNCDLADWLRINVMVNRSETLRGLLKEAIEQFSGGHDNPPSRRHRYYQILKQTYTDQKSADVIINSLGLSRRQYFYDIKHAVDAVTHYIYAQRNQLDFFKTSSHSWRQADFTSEDAEFPIEQDKQQAVYDHS